MGSIEPTVFKKLTRRDAWIGGAVRLGLLMNVPLSHVSIQMRNFIIRGDFLKGCPSMRGEAVGPDGARHLSPCYTLEAG